MSHGVLQITDTHADHTGESASSHDDAESEKSDSGTESDAAKTTESAPDVDEEDRVKERQGVSGHKKIDEVVLVGTGALE